MAAFKVPLKISDLMAGISFELDTKDNPIEPEDKVEDFLWDVEDESLDAYKNPCSTSFSDWKSEMFEILPGVHKKILKKVPETSKQVDLSRTRVTYHRNFYLEGEEHPFDSTYLNGKTDEICLPLKKGIYLEGFLEALGTMKEGEKSMFIICYQKMFMEPGCLPRVKEKADILCEINVLKVEEVGDQVEIDKVMNEASCRQKFCDIKKSVEETRIRAVDYFSAKDFDKATKMYQRILQTVFLAEPSNDAETEDRMLTLAGLHMNLAVCFNKKEYWSEALSHIEQMEEFINIDTHAKAQYHKGLALTRLGENNQALDALSKAQKLKPLDNQVIKALEDLSKRKNEYSSFLKSFSKNLKLT